MNSKGSKTDAAGGTKLKQEGEFKDADGSLQSQMEVIKIWAMVEDHKRDKYVEMAETIRLDYILSNQIEVLESLTDLVSF
ncbi:hypothetical protein ACH5RR_016787 [Cinchona calisaya]|uniref:Uncharacterized protein n=1 Tax=Cinchona calisaya TaxID=153742 RepID=A0ABD3A2J3_9GENT